MAFTISEFENKDVTHYMSLEQQRDWLRKKGDTPETRARFYRSYGYEMTESPEFRARLAELIITQYPGGLEEAKSKGLATPEELRHLDKYHWSLDFIQRRDRVTLEAIERYEAEVKTLKIYTLEAINEVYKRHFNRELFI